MAWNNLVFRAFVHFLNFEGWARPFFQLGKFIVLEGNGKARLVIPFELVLADHNSDHGKMCIRFNYYMNG